MFSYKSDISTICVGSTLPDFMLSFMFVFTLAISDVKYALYSVICLFVTKSSLFMLNKSFIFDSSVISYILKFDCLLLKPQDSLIDILADAKPGSATKSYVNNFFTDTTPLDSVIPAALEETNNGYPSSTNAFASFPQWVFKSFI